MGTELHCYYLDIAEAVMKNGSCRIKKVGAVLVKGQRIIGTGYNGTPEGLTNCDAGGCARCKHTKEYKSGRHYDLCVCVHAETNALLTAARFGVSVDGAVIYSTVQPCFMCSKALIQAGVQQCFYRKRWLDKDGDIFPRGVRDDYDRLQIELRARRIESQSHRDHPAEAHTAD